MEADSLGPRAVEEKRGGRLDRVLTQFVSRVPFREDVFGKAFGAISAIGLLDNVEHQFRRTSRIRHAMFDGRRYSSSGASSGALPEVVDIPWPAGSPGMAPEKDTLVRISEGRHKIVFGVGDEHAKLVFVGEGPGADEDAQGIPFVGRAGQLLTQMIEGAAKKEGTPDHAGTEPVRNLSRTVRPIILQVCPKPLFKRQRLRAQLNQKE
jgi:hypothetical protein